MDKHIWMKSEKFYVSCYDLIVVSETNDEGFLEIIDEVDKNNFISLLIVDCPNLTYVPEFPNLVRLKIVYSSISMIEGQPELEILELSCLSQNMLLGAMPNVKEFTGLNLGELNYINNGEIRRKTINMPNLMFLL